MNNRATHESLIDKSPTVLGWIQTIKNCGTFTDSEVSVFAADLTQKAITEAVRKSGGKWSTELLNGLRESNSATVTSSSAHPVAGHALVSTSDRSIDLAYWRQVKKGTQISAQPEDSRERFVTAGYIKPDEIRGYDFAPEKWLLRRIEHNGVPYILVLDGSASPCVTAGADGRFHFCDRPDAPVPVAAAVRACPPEQPCTYPGAVFGQHGQKTPAHLPPSSVLDAIRKAEVPGLKTRIFLNAGEQTELDPLPDL